MRVDPNLQEMRRRLAAQLNSMADAVVQGSMVVVRHTQVLLTPTILANPGYAEYAKNTADRFEELESFTAALNQEISSVRI